MSELTHLSLFSGIGGLDLAAEWAGFRTIGQCEFADFPTKILEKNFGDIPRWRDIHDLTATEFIRRTGVKTPTVISGGFPCQPHSVAGKRMASDDERDLWPEMRRVIWEIKPKWVIAENVTGLLSSEDGRFFGRILNDFSEMGYDVGWASIRASSVGAIHRRERIAIIAHSSRLRLQRRCTPEKYEKTDEQFERIHLHLLGSANEEYIHFAGILRNYNGFPDRVDRTKSLGNAVCPHQFYWFFRFIADFEKNAI